MIATDPDADRMAVVAMHNDQAHILSGNQIAAICPGIHLPHAVGEKKDFPQMELPSPQLYLPTS